MNVKEITNAFPKEFISLVNRVLSILPELNKLDKIPDVRYDDPNARERYLKVADGFLSEGNCDVENKGFDVEQVKVIYDAANSLLAKAAALNVYKRARAVVHDQRYDELFRNELFEALEDIKGKYRNYGESHDVVGRKENPNRWIYSYENGPMIREAYIKSKKQGMRPIEIVQFSDAHFNYCNERDMREANPALMSTLEYRLWHANGDTEDVTRRSFDFAAMSDQTIVTGDIMDYLSYGAQELTQKTLFWRDANMLAAIGGHEVTREMQGIVEDTTSHESRLEILKSFWCNDIFYESKILGDRVIAVVMDNGSTGKYTEDQFLKLKADIEYAKDNNLIVLIFQHEPLCTANPAETSVEFIRANDANGSRNFYKDYVGGEYTREYLKDEWTIKTHTLIRQNADVIKGVFCGHRHSDFYTEILGIDENGMPDNTFIPQYVLTATVYDNLGHIMKITID